MILRRVSLATIAGGSTLAIVYALFIWSSISYRGIFDYSGVDYRGFLASAQIVRAHGFGAVYDLNLQSEYQLRLYRYTTLADKVPMDVNPTPYLPPFVAVFVPFALFEPGWSFALWTIFNLAVFLIYLRRLRRVSGGTTDTVLIAGIFLALPTVFNFFFGQINVWLLICFGEVLIAWRRGKEFAAGLWLAGFLLKPQMLILFAPGLLIARRFRALAGLTAATIGLLVLSFALAGVDGMTAWARLLTGYVGSQELPTNFPASMMNWRAAGVNLASIARVPIDLWIALPGMLLTALMGLWLYRSSTDAVKQAIVWIGALAATLTVAWHSHIHTALPMLAPLMLASPQTQSARIVRVWLFAPPIVFLGALFVYTPLAVILGVPQNLWGASFAHIITGEAMLILNLSVLVWAWRKRNHPNGL